MTEDNITPEEKLLKIIEEPKGIQKAKSQSRVPKGVVAGLGELTHWFKNLSRIDKDKLRQINLHTVNKIFIGLCALLTVFLFFDFFKTAISLGGRLKNISAEAPLRNADRKDKLTLGFDIKEALGQTKKRNIFTFLPPKSDIDITKKSIDIAQIVANLKLVGIIWSNNPQAIIEDTKESKTYLLSTGEQLAELTIKKILRDKVIIVKGEQEWELR